MFSTFAIFDKSEIHRFSYWMVQADLHLRLRDFDAS